MRSRLVVYGESREVPTIRFTWTIMAAGIFCDLPGVERASRLTESQREFGSPAFVYISWSVEWVWRIKTIVQAWAAGIFFNLPRAARDSRSTYWELDSVRHICFCLYFLKCRIGLKNQNNRPSVDYKFVPLFAEDHSSRHAEAAHVKGRVQWCVFPIKNILISLAFFIGQTGMPR